MTVGFSAAKAHQPANYFLRTLNRSFCWPSYLAMKTIVQIDIPRSARALHWVLPAAFILSLLTGCATSNSSFLNPNGLIAVLQRRWLIEVSIILAIVLLPIFVVLPAILWRYRASGKKASYQPDWDYALPLEIAIWGGPCLIVAVLAVLIAGPQMRYSPENPVSSAPAMRIQAIGMDWKWLFIYPDQHLASLDTLYLPENSHIVFSLTSDGVMQSFFISALSGQVYAMGGMVTTLHLRTGQPNILMGENTQFNGMGFQDEKFQVHVVSTQAFRQWIGQSLSSAPVLTENLLRILSRPGTLKEAREALKGTVSLPDQPPGAGLVFKQQDAGIFAELVRRTRRGEH